MLYACVKVTPLLTSLSMFGVWTSSLPVALMVLNAWSSAKIKSMFGLLLEFCGDIAADKELGKIEQAPSPRAARAVCLRKFLLVCICVFIIVVL
jgi:hypothetical protein